MHFRHSGGIDPPTEHRDLHLDMKDEQTNEAETVRLEAYISNAPAEQASRVEDYEWRTQRLDSRSTRKLLENRLGRLLAEQQRGMDC